MVIKQVTSEDIALIKEAVLFPYIMTTLEHDIDMMMASDLKMKEVYARVLRMNQIEITRKWSKVKKEMTRAGVKVLEEKRGKDRTTTEFLCRGYQQSFTLLYVHLRIEVMTRIGSYLNVDFTDTKTNP